MKLASRKIIAIIIGSILMSNSVVAKDVFLELEQEKKDINQPSKEKVAEFYQWLNDYLDEYEQWRDSYINELDIYRSALIKEWGSGDVSDKNKFVEYSDNNKVKKVIDYDNNLATISILVEDKTIDKLLSKITSEKINIDGINVDISKVKNNIEVVDYSLKKEKKEKKFIINQIESQLQQLDIQAERLILAETGIPETFIHQRVHDKKEKLLQLGQKRLIKIVNLYATKRTELDIDTLDGKSQLKKSKVAKEDCSINKPQEIIEKSDTESKKEVITVLNKKENIIPNKIVSYSISLPAKSLQERAEQYKVIVDKESKRWLIDSSLIMSIIHSESSFKSNAKSYIPAFGLMQVVPTSAGHDVNRYIHKIDAPMKESDFYVPFVNVETGTAYLNILNNRYLKTIKNEQSRMYCMIAAYNTGAGNVAKAFNKDRSTNINKAAIIINKMSSQQVYNHLLKNLPYDETKNYLKKVNNRIALYK